MIRAMSEPDPQPDAVDELLRANREFYRAFSSGDFVAMDRVWTQTQGAMCLHPGWALIHGRGRVMASWRGILRRPLPVQVRDEIVEVRGDAGVVACVEIVRHVELAATNLFVREDGRWRLLHHQAGLIARSEDDEDEDEDDEEPRLLN